MLKHLDAILVAVQLLVTRRRKSIIAIKECRYAVTRIRLNDALGTMGRCSLREQMYWRL